MENLMIKNIAFITAGGVPQTYELGQKLTGGVVKRIVLGVLIFNGDPFQHYIGYDSNGKMLFSIDPAFRHECEYL
jgi:hypothetical protein